MKEENKTAFNELAWVTCPYCGATFRVALPPKAVTAIPLRKREVQYEAIEFATACAGCKEQFAVKFRDFYS